MSKVRWHVYIHMVFSTRSQKPLIAADMEQPLWQAVTDICAACGGPAQRVGGAADHVHVACLLSQKLSVDGMVNHIKARSAEWMAAHGVPDFAWQESYGAFTVSPMGVRGLVTYIDEQKLYHRQWSFQEEFRELLRKNNISFDEREVWE